MPKLLEDTLNPAVRPASGRAPSAATIMAEKPGTIRHAEAPALVATDSMGVVAEEDFTAAVAGIGNCGFVIFLAEGDI
jgi:hypothetical protein